MGAQPDETPLIDVDVAVIGGGPAGCSAAISLAQSGRRVAICAREQDGRDTIGESLSSSATGLLEQLGVWQRFCQDGHLPCYGNKSVWGSDDLRFHDFIDDPRGHGWHIDRPLFEQRLTERTSQLGVVGLPAVTSRAFFGDDKRWRLTIDREARAVTARVVVDATGRVSWFARQHGATRLGADRQVALTAFLSAKGPPLEDGASLVEAVRDGWWYSAVLPDGRLATAFMTDTDLHDRRLLEREARWVELLSQTRHTRSRVVDCGYTLDATPRLVAATSGRLEPIAGDAWVAVGDAALSFDPLSSHGLTVALKSGQDAAAAILASGRGDRHALASYGACLRRVYADYEAMRRRFYRAETRWVESPYWTSRRYRRVPPARSTLEWT